MRDSKQFKERFQRWKNGEQVYEAGRPLPKYYDGKDGKDKKALSSESVYREIMKDIARENYKNWGYNSAQEAWEDQINNPTYDYRGYYSDPEYQNSDANADIHWPDTYKTPKHKTFSSDSKYSGKVSEKNPYGLRGGVWVGNKFIPAAWLRRINLQEYKDGKDGRTLEYNPEEDYYYGGKPFGITVTGHREKPYWVSPKGAGNMTVMPGDPEMIFFAPIAAGAGIAASPAITSILGSAVSGINTVGDALAATAAGQRLTSGLNFVANAVGSSKAWPWINAGLTSVYGTRGIDKVRRGDIHNVGDVVETGLYLMPLTQLAKPVVSTVSKVAGAVHNATDRYLFMPHRNSFTRGIGMTDVGLQDAINTGVFRGNPRGTEQTARVFDKMFLNNRNHFRDIVKDTGIRGIESRYQSRTLTKEDFDALKKAAQKYIEPGETKKIGTIRLGGTSDPLSDYSTYEDYIKAVASDMAKTEQMASRVASGEVVPNTELSEPMWFEDESGKFFLPQGRPILERFGPNSDYLVDGTPLSYWYADGRNPITKGHAYAKSNYGVRVNNPEDYQPFMHELHLHPSFFRSPKFADPNVEIFGRGPFGITVKLDKETLQPVWKRDLSNMFRKKTSIETSQITTENAASITPEQWTAAQDAAIARGDMAEAQRLRDLHFKINAPNTKIVGEDGEPLHLYHGTKSKFNAFDESLYGSTDGGMYGTGVYTTPYKSYAENYGDVMMDLYANISNPVDARNLSIDDLMLGKLEEGNNIFRWTDIGGKRDGVLGKNHYLSTKYPYEVVSHKPNNVKSADVVTYDNSGVRIPLGKRDNFNINDIRYGLIPFILGGTGYGLSQSTTRQK